MEGGRVSDFSIERILSPQLGTRTQVVDFPADGFLRGAPGLDSGDFRPPASVPVPVPVPVPVLSYLQFRGVSCGDAFYPYGSGFHHHTDYSGVYLNSGLHRHLGHEPADVQPLALSGYQQAGVSAQPRQRARMRTVFTDSQTKRLEALFEVTDYPTVEARAEMARNTGLSEETVRVWFKNRRARRKRGGSQVKSPSPPPSCGGAERNLFTSFL